MSLLRSTSLNMPSSLLVNWLPHSAFSLPAPEFRVQKVIMRAAGSVGLGTVGRVKL